jgi:hypothetical protein
VLTKPALQHPKEERLVAELERLGIRYLSRQTTIQAKRVRSPQRLLAALIQQPSSRVRTAVIATFLANPKFVGSLPGAMDLLSIPERQTLKLFYTAAVYLQQKHALRLQAFLGERWQWLPDRYSSELTIQGGQPPDEQLAQLGLEQQRLTGIVANWTGTYENVAHHLMHRWELERKWNQ